jgi:signal transduction histidine kinase
MLTKIRRWLAAPVFQGDEEKSRSAILLNIILWIIIAATLFYNIFAPIDPAMEQLRLAIVVPFLLTLLVFKHLINQGHVKTIGTLVVFAIWLLVTIAMALDPKENNPAFMAYVVVVVCAGLILNWRASLFWSFLSLFTSGLILILGQQNILPASNQAIPASSLWIAQTIYILTSTVLLSLAISKIDEAFARAQREISERKRVEAEREKVIQELEAKNAELERFTYTVSHDLKSPLITISGFVGLLEADAKSGDIVTFKSDLQRINEAVEKMKRLLDELLELSRIGRIINPPSDTPFAKIVEEALLLVQGRLRTGNVEVHVQEGLPTVRGDRPRLVEVLQNLIDNAAKFMVDQPAPKLEIGIRKDRNGPVFFVRDNGIGIESGHFEKVFGLFDKLNPRTEGTGVGLALAKRIVEVHGGHIWVESEGKGRGSTFYFTLPTKE